CGSFWTRLQINRRAILMAIISPAIVVVGTAALAAFGIGALVSWLAARSAQTRLRIELERDRAVHAERERAARAAEGTLRATFQSLSAEALQSNNRAFLDLAESRL